MPRTMQLQELWPQIVIVATIVGAAFVLDARHDPAHSGARAEIRANIYTEQLEADSLMSVLNMYAAKAELGVITDAEKDRRQVVIRQRNERLAKIDALKSVEQSLKEK